MGCGASAASKHQAPPASRPQQPGQPVQAAPRPQPRGPPVDVDLARGFLDALRAEYVQNRAEAVGKYFDSRRVPQHAEGLLTPYEDKVRGASNRAAAISKLESDWGLCGSSPAPAATLQPEAQAASQLDLPNEDAAIEDCKKEICRALSLPASASTSSVLSAGLKADDLEIVRKAIRIALQVKGKSVGSAEFVNAASRLRNGRQLPPDWDISAYASGRFLEGGLGGRQASAVVAFELQSADVVSEIQSIFDATYRKVYTRDRRGAPIPDAFKIKQVYRVMNDQVWREYVAHREKIRSELRGNCPPVPDGALTMNHLANTAKRSKLPTLDGSLNEAWLFHGTSADAARGIAENDFRLDLTGTNAGTLYGRGIYLAENVTKSDEYGEGPKGPAGEQMERGYEGPRPPPGPPPTLVRDSYILMCRSTLGRVHYNDERQPNPDHLQRSCTGGQYTSVIGDRLKINGTFREIIVYSDDLVYPEYVVHYERIFFHERFREIYLQMKKRQLQGRFRGPTKDETEVLKSMWSIYGMPNRGKINKWQLLDLLIAIEQPPENEEEDLDATFREWDTKKNGYIDYDEFMQEIQTRINDMNLNYYE